MNKAILDKIDELQSVIDKHGILDAAIQNKINYRFRLDWNYYSNEMEGNSLTRMETRQLMIENVTVGNKPLKDVLEMSGHDKEVLEIMRVGKGAVRLSESRIKAMHRAIMYESDPEKKQHIGYWKSDRNYVINYKGEKFEFVAPEDVADSVHQLLNTTNAQIDAINAKQKDAIHPVELAFQFHLEYVRIHPFYDGNGRTARLLTNLLLISLGFPPIILRKNERERYYKYLAEIQGYGANPDLFLELMGELVIHSQELVLDAIAGKDIEEEDDLDKEIALWKNELDHEIIVLPKTKEAIVDVFTRSVIPLFDLFIKKHKQFDDLFVKNNIDYLVNYSTVDGQHNDVSFIHQINDESSNIGLRYQFFGFSKDRFKNFNFSSEINIFFKDFSYEIALSHTGNHPIINKPYSENLTNEEITVLINFSVKETFEKIKGLKDAPPF
ncbi:MAG: Fic family protein [Fluviicola sp.]|nr:Fic family protein [Fluviicola sp.]